MTDPVTDPVTDPATDLAVDTFTDGAADQPGSDQPGSDQPGSDHSDEADSDRRVFGGGRRRDDHHEEPFEKKPSVVALGGGYGLSTTLRALRRYAGFISGIVSVADDGGSSGRLRKAFGIPAPGDLRRCLVALAEPGSAWAEAFEHRFAASELEGHPLGNIVIAGLTETLGDFGAAIDVCLEMLGGVGHLIPASREPVVLKATYRYGRASGEVEGEAEIGKTAGIMAVSIIPEEPKVSADALDAIAEADQIVIGPGSLYTSLLAVLAIPSIRTALADSRARKVYVANLAEQHPETTGYDVARHVQALQAHGVEVDVVLRDPDRLPLGHLVGPTVIDWPMADSRGLHDPEHLAAALRRLARP